MPSSPPPTFRIVVATRHRPDDLATLLGRLAPQLRAHAEFRLTVVNDASPGPGYDAVIARHRQFVDYRVLQEHHGPGPARQAGLAGATEDYFITTDDDCLPDADWLDQIRALVRAHPEAGLFAGSTRPALSDHPGIMEHYIVDGGRLPGAGVSETGALVMAVCAIMMCRRTAFEAVGGFSPEIHGSSEDWNLTYRLVHSGCRYLVVPSWTVGHRCNATLGQTLRRHYHYGFGTAQHVLLEQDWKAAVRRGNGTVGAMILQALAAGRAALAGARRAGRTRAVRWSVGLIGVVAEAAQQWGWRQGLAHYGARYGRRLPEDLDLALASPLRQQPPAVPADAAPGGGTRPSIRIVVPTYRRPDDLETFLEAMAPQVACRRHVRLVVVNDGSHDSAYQRVVDRFAEAIDYRPQAVNRGPSPSRAIGYQDATEDYLVFTDDDCIALPGWLAWLEALIDAHPEVDLFAGTTVPVNTDRPSMTERLLTYTGKFPAPVESERGLVIAMTANVACRREAYVAAGGYDPRMNTAGEDWNLTVRLLESGASYRVCRDWVIGHKARQGFQESWRRYYGYGWGGAQNLLLTGDWPAAYELHCGTNLRGSLEMIRRWIADARSSPDIAASAWPVRLGYCALAGLFAMQYERGWRAGLGHFSRALGREMPKDLPLRGPLARFITSPPTPRA